MTRELTLDEAGRLELPEEVREHHRLQAGSRLTLIDEDDRLVLVPTQPLPKISKARLVEENGLLVVTGPEQIDLPDHRRIREERLADLDGLG